jgi:hypothetical protein
MYESTPPGEEHSSIPFSQVEDRTANAGTPVYPRPEGERKQKVDYFPFIFCGFPRLPGI